MPKLVHLWVHHKTIFIVHHKTTNANQTFLCRDLHCPESFHSPYPSAALLKWSITNAFFFCESNLLQGLSEVSRVTAFQGVEFRTTVPYRETKLDFSYHFHLQQVHLLPSLKALELQPLVHFEQQHAEVCEDKQTHI